MLNINKENFSSMEIEYNTKKQIKIKKATSYSDLRFCFVEKGWAVSNAYLPTEYGAGGVYP